MSFLAPWLLAGLVGLAVPVVAHLLGRDPPVPLAFAGRRFLAPAQPSVTQRRAIRDWPLLIVRLALLALVVLVLARPVLFGAAADAVVAEPHDAVIVVDASGSLQLR